MGLRFRKMAKEVDNKVGGSRARGDEAPKYAFLLEAALGLQRMDNDEEGRGISRAYRHDPLRMICKESRKVLF